MPGRSSRRLGGCIGIEGIAEQALPRLRIRAATVRRCETIIHEANRRSTAKNFALGATKRDRRRLGIHFPAPSKGPEIDSFTPSYGRGSDDLVGTMRLRPDLPVAAVSNRRAACQAA